MSSRLPRLASFSAALLASITAAGCDGSPSAGEAVVHIVGGTCDKVHECRGEYPGLSLTFEATWGASVEDCRRRFGLTGVVAGVIEDSVNAGRISYHVDAAESCIEGIDSARCEDLWGALGGLNEPAACALVFQPTVPTGAACSIDDDCASEGDVCVDRVCAAGD